MDSHRRRILALVIALGLVLVACGGTASEEGAADAGGSEDTGGTGTDTAGTETAAVAGSGECTEEQRAALRERIQAIDPVSGEAEDVDPTTFDVERAECRWSIGVVLPHFKDPYFLANAHGIEREAERLGVEVRILAAQGYGDVTTQIGQMDNFIAQGVDGLIVGSTDSEALGAPVDAAWEQGIPAVYDEIGANSEINIGSYTNDEQAGALQAEYIAEQDPNARVIAFCGPPGAGWATVRCESFKATLAELAPDAVVVAEKYHDMDRAVIADVAGNTLQAFPDATWVYNSTDLQAKGVVDALRAAGRQPGDIQVTNVTMGRELFDMLQEGWITYALAERGVAQGQITLQRLVAVLNGQDFPAIWYSSLPGFENAPEDISRFEAEEAEFNWEPEGYQPAS